MSASRVMVELTPDEYVQLLDDAEQRSAAGAPGDVSASPDTRDYDHAEDYDPEERSFAAGSNTSQQSAAGLADERAALASAPATAAGADAGDQDRDPDPHFDKLATENATARPPSSLPGSAFIDTAPTRTARGRMAPARRRTRDGKAPRRSRRRWIILTSSAVPLVVLVLVLVLELTPQPTGANSARTTTAVSEPALTIFGDLVTSASQDVAALGRHAEAAIDTQAARALRQRRIAGRRHQRARPPRAQRSRTTASRGASVQASQVSTPTTASVAAQSAPAASNPSSSSPSTSTYTHQQAGPTSLGSQVGSNCDPTCR